MVKEGDILYALYGATSGEVARSKLKGAINQAILAILPQLKYDSEYITQWLKVKKQYIVDTYLQGGQGNLSGSIVKNLVVDFPNYNEQINVGELFYKIDHLITLHQSKCFEYVFVDAACHTLSWEQRKLGEILSESREIGHKGDTAKKITVKLWGKGVFEKKEVGSAATQYYVRHTNQFIYSKLDFLNSAFGVIPKKLDCFESTADLPAFDCNDINPYFLYYRVTQPDFYFKNGMIADGSRKAKRIHSRVFLNMELIFPNEREQQNVVKLLQSLDHLITLHQSKLEKLQKIKKSMLESMFV